MKIPKYIENDEVAAKIGAKIAFELDLKKSRKFSDRFELAGGTFTKIGLARRVHRLIAEEFI